MENVNANRKVVVVTGGGSGIGRACVEKFLVAGDWDVVAADLQFPNGTSAPTGELQAHMDVSDPSMVDEVFATIVREVGPIHAVVHCAGIKGDRVSVGEYQLSRWQQIINVNLNGTFYAMRSALPHLADTRGSFVAMASTLGLISSRHTSAYTAAKHGVVGLVKSAALDYADSGVRVNAIAPAFIDTPFLQISTGVDDMQEVLDKHPLGRLGRPEEVAAMALFLSTENAAFTTGSVFSVDGGYTAQ
ncbi:SDR family NAD(P)-dependent oxidoreductase [Arthrobacter sulfonylureivorans]|uniref:SDR family oxidoreductase n=1 Tax=Arthrobacter sulfonylureivorans TaxID=2486855 RepID=A0ABY3WBP1_9MICC|nr:SDR family oxidoreductase [Arthrobacter sulfonylureivorans]UNK47773.1 SDR family oxidoreductase [Arthrobacter sulfonylureivorans]